MISPHNGSSQKKKKKNAELKHKGFLHPNLSADETTLNVVDGLWQFGAVVAVVVDVATGGLRDI